VTAALSASTRPVLVNAKCLRIARTSRSPLIVATPLRPGPSPRRFPLSAAPVSEALAASLAAGRSR
jgi:hypothetical protein